MRNSYRTLALAVSLSAAAVAYAQAPAPAKGANPAARGDNVFYYGPLSGSERANTIGNPLNNTGIGRPNARNQSAQVTPVPEPSQWAMMLAGLALVGFIVRRNSKRS
ncbi:MAG: PEPxxWA-CTERM sorting domain-containing protein [Usitatibacter sp.]